MSDPYDSLEGNSIGSFDLGKKTELIFQDFSRRADIMIKSLTSLTSAGTSGGGGAFGGQLVSIGKAQLRIQNQMLSHLTAMRLKAAAPTQIGKMHKQLQLGQQQQLKNNFNNIFNNIKKQQALGSGKQPGGIWDSIKGLFSSFRGIFKSMFGGMKKIWDKTGGEVFKKTGAMGINKLLGLGGATVIGALVGKMISSSPLLQAMFKIMNTSLTLILRPIGDFVGSFLRPISMYFLKEVAIPAFKQGKGLMNIGEKWGKIAVGFFVSPAKAISTGIALAFEKNNIAKTLFGITDQDIKEAKLYQEDPAKYKRYMDEKKIREDKIKATMTGQAGMHTTVGGHLAGFGGSSLAPMPGLAVANPMPTENWWEWNEPIAGGLKDVADNVNEFEDTSGETTIAAEEGKEAADSMTVTIQELDSMFQEYIIRADGTYKEIDAVQHEQAELQNQGWLTVNESTEALGGQVDEVTEVLKEGGNTWWDTITEVVTGGATWLGEAFDGLINSIDLSNIGLQAAFAETETKTKGLNNSLALASGMFGGGTYAEAVAGNVAGVTGSIQGKNIMDTGMSLTEYEDAIKAEQAGMFSGTKYTMSKPILSPDTPLSEMPGLEGNVGWQNQSLGQHVGEGSMLFESSPGTFVNIYKNISGVKTAIDPHSVEGKKIQGIYNQQLKNTIANQQQQKHTSAIRSFTTAAEGQAYVMAGGGEKGLEAAKIVKNKNISLTSFEGLSQFGKETGIKNTMISIADEAVKERGEAGVYDHSGFSFDDLSHMDNTDDAVTTANLEGIATDKMETNFLAQKKHEATKLGPKNMARASDAQIWSKILGGSNKNVKTTSSGVSYYSSSNVNSSLLSATPGWSPAGFTSGTSSITGSTYSGSSSGYRGGSMSGSVGSTTAGGGGWGMKGGGTTSKAGTNAASKKQFGGIIDEPIIGYGTHSGREWRLGESENELVTPISQVGADGNQYNINIHIGNVSQEADYRKLKPLIQRWILEASSRRGVV